MHCGLVELQHQNCTALSQCCSNVKVMLNVKLVAPMVFSLLHQYNEFSPHGRISENWILE